MSSEDHTIQQDTRSIGRTRRDSEQQTNDMMSCLALIALISDLSPVETNEFRERERERANFAVTNRTASRLVSYLSQLCSLQSHARFRSVPWSYSFSERPSRLESMARDRSSIRSLPKLNCRWIARPNSRDTLRILFCFSKSCPISSRPISHAASSSDQLAMRHGDGERK